jgi:hypothetical protein
MFGFLKRRKTSSYAEYLKMMIDIAQIRIELPNRNSCPIVPEIFLKAQGNIGVIFRSETMSRIPVNEFETGAFNAMRYSFALGVVMADVWHSDFGNFGSLRFSVIPSEIAKALGALGITRDEFESLAKLFMDGFVKKTLKSGKNVDIRVELNNLLLAAHMAGAGVYLNRNGFK